MNASNQTGFYYHADASALGGILKLPLDLILATRASVSLAQAGGFSTSRADRFHMDGLVSFESAQVTVFGSEDREHGSWRTIATASVERLNIFEVVTADRIVAQVSVMHPYGRGFAEISLNGAQYVNLRVNGAAVNPTWDKRAFSPRPVEGLDQEGKSLATRGRSPRFSDLLKTAEEQYGERTGLQKRAVERLGSRFAMSDPRTDLDEKGSSLCSLVQEVEAEDPIEAFGPMLHVPDFGHIFFGEMLVSRFSAQLTMLRLELGCVAHGTLSVCSAFSNGHTMP